jgi:hypothetical protein
MWGSFTSDSVSTMGLSVFLTEMLLSGKEVSNLLLLCLSCLLDHIGSAQQHAKHKRQCQNQELHIMICLNEATTA